MLNCHFDSAPGSPGASDDSVMCCVMIETLRVLARSGERQKNSIIFLFNGAEEVGLLGSHGFIAKHKWANDVKAFINLESSGSGGREILFRSSPKHNWLVRLYRESVPRPFGHAFADELFETGIIPAATDFEVFSGDAGIPGLDFAYVKDGWRYHTRYDMIDYIPMKSVQYTGENILALTKKISNADELSNQNEGPSAVYFDYLGLFFISYTQEVGAVLNITFSVLAVIVQFIIQTQFKLSKVGSIAMETLVSFGTVIVSTTLSAGACYLMALFMNSCDNTMSWYSTTFLSIGIYGSLAVLTQIATYHLVQILFDKISKPSSNKQESLMNQFIGISLFWACLTITITVRGYRSGYIPMVLLVGSLFTSSFLDSGLSRYLPKTSKFRSPKITKL